MKITFVSPKPSLAGGTRVIATYAEHLQNRGHDVLVVHPRSKRITLKQKIQALLSGQGWLKDKSRESSPSHFDGKNIKRVILDSYRPVMDADIPDADVVIATWWETAEWVNALAPSKGAKAYFIQHHETFDYLDKDRVQATYRFPLHKITISKWLVDLMTNTYGDLNVSWVPNSVDTHQFNADPRAKQLMPTVGFLYGNVYWKGSDVCFKALEIVAKHFPNLQVFTFGHDPLPEDLSLPYLISHTKQPPQDSIKNIYASCDVWLCGSRSEGFGLPPLEAMACRCPVVSTMVAGPVDFVRHGINGFLAPIEDSNALAAYLLDVLKLSEDTWKEMSDAAHATATQYTWEDATDKFEAALQHAIDRGVVE